MSPPAQSGARPPPRRVGLGIKLAAGLLVIAVVPLLVSMALVGRIATLAQNFAANEVAYLRPSLESSKDVYLALIDTKKSHYRNLAQRMAEVLAATEPAPAPAPDGPAAGVPIASPEAYAGAAQLAARLLRDEPELLRVVVISAASERRALASREETSPPAGGDAREKVVEAEVGGGARVELVFAVDASLQDEYVALGQRLDATARIVEMRAELPSSYRTAFIVLVGGVGIFAVLIGLILARRISRRVEVLLEGTRRVSRGDLEARVRLSGRDEMAELGWAFNAMVEDLERDREQIRYLQQMGAWEDVARKLAHEIKNPLTPIQLAVQQCVSTYPGDDVRYKKMLAATDEIVTEEIAGLRRLVDAFRTLGQLPKVDAKPIALADVIDDLRKDPVFAPVLIVEPSAATAQVRGDRLLLRRVLANLVENAAQAGKSAGRQGRAWVRLEIDEDREQVRVCVEDEGAGVDAEARARIFEPYVTTKDDGTGLGLAISKKLALEHGGSLQVDDKPGSHGGARFVLTLPRLTERPAADD